MSDLAYVLILTFVGAVLVFGNWLLRQYEARSTMARVLDLPDLALSWKVDDAFRRQHQKYVNLWLLHLAADLRTQRKRGSNTVRCEYLLHKFRDAARRYGFKVDKWRTYVDAALD